MPVLLLCYGDMEAKNLLRAAIEARYSINPPVIESLSVEFKGRARAKVGPVKTWVPVDTTAHFHFPTHIRWDFIVKPLGLSVQRGIEAFDGTTYRTLKEEVITDEKRITTIRRRLWSIAAILLTPLSDQFIKVTNAGERCFEALNTKLDDAVTLCLRDDNTIDHTEVMCFNPDTGKEQRFVLRVSPELAPVDGLLLPKKISAFWDDEPSFEIEPVHVEVNPALEDALFTLEAEEAE